MASMSLMITFAKIISDLPRNRGGETVFDRDDPATRNIVNRSLDQFFNFAGDAGDNRMLMGAGFMNCNRIQEQI